MQSDQIIQELQSLSANREQIDKRMQGLSDQMQFVIGYIDSLDAAREQVITGETLPREARTTEDGMGDVIEEYVSYPVSLPPIKEGTLTVYLDGSVVDPVNYEVDHAAGEIRPLASVSEDAVVTADYTYRGERADVLDIAKQLEGYSLLELADLRSKYVTAVDWIRQNFDAG